MANKTVFVELVAETRKLNQGLKKADQQVKKSTVLMKKLAVAVGGIFAFAKIKQWIVQTGRWALEIDKLSREMRITVHEAQQLSFFADATGVSMANIRDAAFEIKKRFGEIGENKRFRETMQSLGLGKDSARKLNNAQLMFLTLQRIADLPLEKQEIALDQAFGGGAAKELNQLVKDAVLLNKLLERAGGVRAISGDFGSLQEMNTTLALIRANFEAISTELLIKTLPTVNTWLDKLNEVALTTDSLKLLWVGVATAGVAALALIASALGPVGLAVAGIAAGITSIALNWKELGQAIKLTWMDINKGIEGFATNIHGSLNPFVDTASGPAVPLAPQAATPFDKGIRQQVQQTVRVEATGLTWEQVKAGIRREGGVTARGAVR